MQNAVKNLKIVADFIAGLTSPDSSSATTLNIERFRAREKQIGDLNAMLASVVALSDSISAKVRSLNDAKTAELEMAKQFFINSADVPTQQLVPQIVAAPQPATPQSIPKPWAMKVAATSAAISPAKMGDRMVSLKPTLAAATAVSSIVKITENLSVQAVVVSSFNDVRQNGQLYYVQPNDHFAIVLGGMMIHGNIGTVYDSEREPEKIKDCRFGSECNRMHKCNYYHDPTIFPTSTDHRNFIATSFTYSKYKNGRNRSFGSRPHLEEDVLQITCDEAYKFYDQTMHDILCALVLISAGKIR